MKLLKLSFYAILIVAAGSCADRRPEPAHNTGSSLEISPETKLLLSKIDAAGAYGMPDIEPKQDRNYANTAADLEPFGHVKPHKEHFLVQLEYTGPGRAIPEPNDLDTVKIGFIGPIRPTVSVASPGQTRHEQLGVNMLQGAQLAIEHANQASGYLDRSIPFELVVKNDNGLWGASGNEFIDMAYKDKVWAVLGTIDGANTHIAIRVALKAEVPVMNSSDTDPTLVETNIPWIFRCISDDRQQGYLLVDYMYRKLNLKRVGIIRSSSRYGRFGVREIRDSSRRLGRPIILEMAYELGTTDFSLHINRLKNENLDAIVHWGDATEGADILNQIRAAGMQQPFFACDRCLTDQFLNIAGDNAEGVICTSPWNPTEKSERLSDFTRAYKERFSEEPETFAAHAYDGMNMLIWSIQVAGLNRAKVRDLLAYRRESWKGVTGDIVLSAMNDDIGDVYLAQRINGTWMFHSREDLKIPQSKTTPPDTTDGQARSSAAR